MNWLEIINDSELVYASTPEDKDFCTWSLKKTTCNVSFYESYPVENIDKIICTIIENAEGIIAEEKLATILGFNVIDDFDVAPKRYADKAELDIFKAIVKPVLDWGLIEKVIDIDKSTDLKLTKLGQRGLKTKIKHKFYSGNKILLENFNLKSSECNDNIFFPFHSALGIYSGIENIEQIPYKNISIDEIFGIDDTELIQRHKLQSQIQYNIYKSDVTLYFIIESCVVDIRLYKQGNDYYPIIYYNNQICNEATELLNKPENKNTKEKKVEWGLYLKLIKDPNTILDYETIIPFEDLLEFDSLIKDTRLVWSDKQLFTFIAETANANQWFSLSNHCPTDVLKQYLQTFKDKLDWTSLSLRIDDDFLIQNATKLPWNFEAISAKDDIGIEVIKTLLLIPELKEQEWDWDNIMPQLDSEFIKSNIDRIDFDLSEITKTNNDDFRYLIAQYPEKRWDWTYISKEYELSFILSNILNFNSFVNLKNVINRAFISENDINIFCSSDDFKKVLLLAKDSTLKDYSPNQSKYIWTNQLIELLETTGFLIWESGRFTSGFECNTNIDWNTNYFKKFHSKISTQRGFDFVSAQISDVRIVNEYPDFHWNWDVVSANPNLITDSKFLLSVKDKLNFSVLLSKISSITLEAIFYSANILSYLEINQKLWINVTEKSSKEFVLQHIDYNWDWEYLTRKLDKDFVINNLSKYKDNWIWEILMSERLEKQDLLLSTHLEEIAACISILDKEKINEIWKIITCKFVYHELVELIALTYNKDGFYWDYTYFYNLPNFNPRQYLIENVESVDWSLLSGSMVLNNAFKWDKSLFNQDTWLKDILKLLKNSEYRWDFKSLSKLDNINWNDSILSIKSERWDWDYLSEYSSCFKKSKDFTIRFRRFSRFIRFSIFSERTDSEINERLLSDYLDSDWDWTALSSNNSLKISFSFLKNQKDKPWDWQTLSIRDDIKFDNETLVELSNKDWDWVALSNRQDIRFSEDLISKLFDKPFDWISVSQKKTFVPNTKTLTLLKGQTLDWSAISQNKNIEIDILWDYKVNLEWEFLTKNEMLDISNVELLSKYRDYLDWNYISQSEKFKILFENLKQFKYYLNWQSINNRIALNISEELLEPFEDVLNWSNVSQSMDIHFTEELIEKYRNKWDWQLLRKNPQVIERLDTILRNYKAEFNAIAFLDQFKENPYVYHFTHLFNATQIITERKIKCRNKVRGQFYNCAGTIADKNKKGHNFARFYYRPLTPNQLYNECLGIDTKLFYETYKKDNFGNWQPCNKSRYTQSKLLGLPRNPMPICFKFDLKEIVFSMLDKCYYSDGCMQTERAKLYKVSENPSRLNTIKLFSSLNEYNYGESEQYKEFVQQEFLVIHELDFKYLNNFELICYSDEFANLLKKQLGNDPICDKITSYRENIFHNANRKLNIKEDELSISISSEFKDEAYLCLRGAGIHVTQILNPENIKKENSNELIAYPKIQFTKTEEPIEVYFVESAYESKEWLVYKN